MTIIIDTDPGIDDAIAILYALSSGQDIHAITTVAGNLGVEVTTRNALRILALAGRTLPVHRGAASPLQQDARPELAIHGEDGLGGVAFPAPIAKASPIGAVDAIFRAIEAAPPGTISLFCLGPLTNLAQLILTAPEAAGRLGPVVAMGGTIREPGNAGTAAEFNLAQDPLAAEIVLSAGLDLTLVPLDATRQLRSDAAYVDALRKAGTPAAKASASLIAAYFDGSSSRQSRPLHDPCVPLFHARPELFDIESMDLSVDPNSGALKRGPHAVKVAMGLDAERLREDLLRGLFGQPSSSATTAHQNATPCGMHASLKSKPIP